MQTSAPISSRETWIDFTRILATFLVILAHVVLYPNIMGAGPIWSQTLYFAFSRIAVPLFFMVSGYLLLPKQESWGTFFTKRTLKVLIPFLVWSVIYMAVLNGEFAGGLSVQAIIRTLLKILRGPRAAHLWFFYVLIGLYLFTPILRVFIKNATQNDLLYFCGLWFMVNPVFSLLQHYTSIRIGFEFEFVTGYIGYYMIGLYLSRLELNRRLLVTAIVVFLAAFAFTSIAIYFGQQQKNYDQFFEDYLSINVIIMTASAFLVLRKVKIPENILPLILPVSGASLGIYLVHILVLESFNRFFADNLSSLQNGSSIYIMPLITMAAFVVSFAFIFIIQRIPILRYIAP